MKTIGLIGGMSWESSAEYYRMINEETKRRRGGLHSAKCILFSVDFAEMEILQAKGKWEEAGQRLGEAALALEKAGADFIVICTNTMHKVVSQIEAYIKIPVLHIADATAAQIKTRGLRKVGLLGTSYTMEQDFYKSRIIDFGIDIVIPNETEREMIHRIIYEELCLGKITQESKEVYKQVIDTLRMNGAEGIILGCTEIGLLVQEEDSSVPLFNTTSIHTVAAVNKALS
ncbi:aspartate/glutamate racemase family protein [Alkalihalobacterium bogoriense]|uniref:aspartate/glutamate racemase family protein n=1 Tax=Alkalihalobacterium bogoriense TaxID=246272 RepID=UPI00047E2AC5|nr:aspartate/glutamate racemase family protein [Alkalihalobacterium bogoriense]